MKIIALGCCCKKSRQNFYNAQIAAQECGIENEVINIGDMQEIMKYGVMSTPALVINEKVVSIGRVLSVKEIKKLIEENK